MSHLPQATSQEKRILSLLTKGIEPSKPNTTLPKKMLRYRSSTVRRAFLLEDLNNDVLAIIVDFLFEADPPSRKHHLRSHPSTLALSLTSKRLRAMCIPVLFRDVYRITPSMGELNYRLRDLEGNPMLPLTPSILPYVKTCDIITTSRHTTTFCRARLARTLPKMTSLLELSIIHRKAVDVSGLRATFEKAEVKLPTVLGLRIQSYSSWAFLVEACPNVEVLVLANNLYHDDMMEAVNGLDNLYHLELSSETWCLKDIEHLSGAVSEIRSLALKGEIGGEFMSSFADYFGCMQCLEVLAIATLQHVSDKDLEDEFSDDASGDYECWMEMQEQHQFDEDQLQIAQAYFESCGKLETLYLVRFRDSSEWRCKRHPDGSVHKVYSPQGSHTGVWAPRNPDHDAHGFPEVLWFLTQALIWEDKDYPIIEPVARTGKGFSERIAEKKRYMTIKYNALKEGLWDGGSLRW